MCRLIEERCQRERQEGRLEGKLEGLMSSVMTLAEKMGLTIDAAMDFLNVPADEREQLKAKL